MMDANDNSSFAEDSDEDIHYLYFETKLLASELLDSEKYPPTYKTQYTVTGAMRKRKIKNKTRTGKLVDVNNRKIALFKYNEDIFAIENSCIHQGGPLVNGDIEDLVTPGVAGSGACVSCPYHGWTFDLQTGKCHVQEGESDLFQNVFPTKVNENGLIMIGFKEISPNAFEEIDF